MSKPKITLITCTYYRPDLLRRAILSVQNQTFEDYEHIIVSDSEPFGEHVYEEFKEDKRIKFFKTKDHVYNLGSLSFNLGMEMASSDYICYLLDDDVLYENHLSVHYNHSRRHSKGKSILDWVRFYPPKDTVKSITKTSMQELANMTHDKETVLTWNDVGTISHTRQEGISTQWKTQQELGSHPEDDDFMERIGLFPESNRIGEVTYIKIGFGGYSKSKEDTNGVDSEYHQLLMNKLVEDSSSDSGYRLESDTPYVYPEFKNTLFGES